MLGGELGAALRDWVAGGWTRRPLAWRRPTAPGRSARVLGRAIGVEVRRYGGCGEVVGAARALRYTGRHWKNGEHGLKAGGPIRPGAALRSAVSPKGNEVHL